MKHISKGEIFFADLNPVIGSEQGGLRPVLIIQDNLYLKNSSTVLVAPLTKLEHKKFSFPTHVFIKATGYLKYDSVILLEHIREIDKIRLKQFLTKINLIEQKQVNEAIINIFNLREEKKYEK